MNRRPSKGVQASPSQNRFLVLPVEQCKDNDIIFPTPPAPSNEPLTQLTPSLTTWQRTQIRSLQAKSKLIAKSNTNSLEIKTKLGISGVDSYTEASALIDSGAGFQFLDMEFV